MAQAQIFLSGLVQGVGFRKFVKSQAQHLGITGWVKNLPDGRVEAFAVGEKKTIENLIAICCKGPFLSDVKDVAVEWEPSTYLENSVKVGVSKEFIIIK